MPKNPVNVILMLVLASFVIDRIVAAVLFLLSFSPSWATRFPDPVSVEGPEAKRAAYKSHKLIYVVLATILAFAFLESYKSIGVLSALRFESEAVPAAEPTPDAAISPTPTPTPIPASASTAPQSRPRTTGDFLLTLLILVGGAENIAKLLKGYGAPDTSRSESQPVEITGKLTLEDRSEKRS